MKYILLAANNINTVIDFDIFDTKKEAQKAMREAYNSIIAEFDKRNCETTIEPNEASVYCDHDLYYWNVSEINT